MAKRTLLASIPDKPDQSLPGYFPFPNQLGKECANVGAIPLMVYVALAIHAGTDGRCWPSIGRIAGITRLSKRTVKRAIQRLAKTGWIKQTFRRGTSTLYHIKRGDTTVTTPTSLVVTGQSPEQEERKANGVPIRRAPR